MPPRKKTKSCPSCGGKFVKGRIVNRVLLAGIVRQRVCQACAKLAVPVLATDAPAHCMSCGTNLARFCHGCVGKALEDVHGKNVVKMLAIKATRVNMIKASAKAKKEEIDAE